MYVCVLCVCVYVCVVVVVVMAVVQLFGSIVAHFDGVGPERAPKRRTMGVNSLTALKKYEYNTI